MRWELEEHERRRAAWKAECLEDGGEWVEGREGPACVYLADGSWKRAIERAKAKYQPTAKDTVDG